MSILSTFSALKTVRFEQLRGIIDKHNPGIKYTQNKIKHRDLYALGHLNNDYKKRKAEIVQATLFPLPCQIKSEQIRLLLVGFRNQSLLTKISKAAERHNVMFKQENNQDLPDRITLTGRCSEVNKLIRDLKELKVSLFGDLSCPGSWRLVHEAQSVENKIKEHMGTRNPIDVSDEINDFEIFCPEKNQYFLWKNLQADYRYKMMLIRRSRYKYWLARKKDNGKWELWQNDFQGDLLFAKWAIIQTQGTNSSFFVKTYTDGRVGFPEEYPVPQEYHRVLCLCSGLVPILTEKKIVYFDIPEVIKQEICNKLRYTL